MGWAISVCLGWLDVLLMGVVAWKIYRSHRVALGAMILLGTSELFLLHTRQCRYYSLVVGGEILLVYGAHELLAEKRRGIWLMALALVVQFYSNYIIAAANLPALFFLVWLMRGQGWRAVRRVAAVTGCLGVVALPWLVFAHSWGQSTSIGDEDYLKKIRIYVMDFHFYFLPLCVLALPLGSALWRRWRGVKRKGEFPRAWEQFSLVLLPLYLAVIISAPGIYLRYLLPVLPIAGLLTAAWLFRYLPGPVLAGALIAVQPVCNVVSAATGWPWHPTPIRFPLVEYVTGVATPYADRFGDVLAFFQAHARPGDAVMTPDPEFPLIFYTQLKIINAVFLTEMPANLPDWILIESPSGLRRRKPSQLSDALRAHYDTIILSVHDSGIAANYPEPFFYEYRSTSNRKDFIIYKLKAAP